MISLSPKQAQVYNYLCTAIEPGALVPTITELSEELDINPGLVSVILAILSVEGLLRREQSTYCNHRIYYLRINNASYEIRTRATSTRGELDPWAEARACGY